MKYTTLGNTDLKLSTIAHGAFAIGGNMWGGNEKKDSIDSIHASLDHGVTSIDTAPFYGFGLSEEMIGEAIKGKDRSSIQLLTKFGLVWDGSNEGKGEFFFDAEEGGKMLNRTIENDLVPYALDNKLGIIVYSPMERGLLTGKYFKESKLKGNDHRNGYFSQFDLEKVKSFLKTIEPIAHSKGVTLSQLVLHWTTLQPGISVVLAGARNSAQAIANAQALDFKLTADELLVIDNESRDIIPQG